MLFKKTNQKIDKVIELLGELLKKEYPEPEPLPDFEEMKNEMIANYPQVDISALAELLRENIEALEGIVEEIQEIREAVDDKKMELQIPSDWEGTPWKQLEKTNKLLEENLKVNKHIEEHFFN